jgi:hypothetical protein
VSGPTQGMNNAEAAQAELMRRVLSGVTLVSLPVAGTMPCSVLVFWITNNGLSLAYTGALQTTPVRNALGLPPLPLPRSAAEAASNEPPPAPPLAPTAVNRAQLQAALSLASLAESFAASGKLDEAVTMQLRAVGVRSSLVSAGDAWQLWAQRRAGGGASAEAPAGSTGAQAPSATPSGAAAPSEEAATEAAQLRDALWRLVELQEQAGLFKQAAESVERWASAGGEPAAAQERLERLRKQQQPPATADTSSTP